MIKIILVALFLPLFSFADNVNLPSPFLPTDERIEAIKLKVNGLEESTLWANVSLEENNEIKMPARSKVLENGQGVIQFNSKLFDLFPQAARLFILYHELGHIRLDHSNIVSLNPGFAEAAEYEADVFACFMAKRFDIVNEELAIFIIDVVEKHSGSEQFGKNRASLIQSILFKF